jgi:hypothetical protein
MSFEPYPYKLVNQNAGNKKWCSAIAAADYGDGQALWRRPGHPTLNAPEVGACRLLNRSGVTALVGLGGRYANDRWQAGQVTSAGVYTDDTTDAQNVTTNDFLLYQHLLTDGNGVLFSAAEPFNVLGFILATAGNQTTPVAVPAYWNGTAWTDLTGMLLLADALTVTPGEKVLFWTIPNDWVVGGSGTNVPQILYNLRLTLTTAGQGTIDPLMQQVFLGYGVLLGDPVADLGQGVLVGTVGLRFPKSVAALAPIFSVPSSANAAEIQVRTYG